MINALYDIEINKFQLRLALKQTEAMFTTGIDVLQCFIQWLLIDDSDLH